MTAPADPNESDESLCVGCGLCCDGTFLVRGHLFPDEDSEALSLGRVETVELEGKPYFNLPCPHFTGACCSIYEKRFTVCRSYRCKLLRQHEAGELTYAEANEAIATARSLVAAVSATDPEAAKSSVRIRMRAELAELRGSVASNQRAAVARRLLNMVALDEFMKSRFLNREDTSAPDKKEGKQQ